MSMFAAIGIAACQSDLIQPKGIATLVIELSADSVPWGGSSQATVHVRDRQGRLLPNAMVTWTSSNDAVLEVTSDGTIRGLRPGYAHVIASTAAARDSLGVRVVSSACSYLEVVRSPNNGYRWTLIHAGFATHAGTPSGHTEYRGVPTFWGSGLLYGTSPDTMLVGADYAGLLSDFDGGVCRIGESTAALVTRDHLGSRPPTTEIDNLIVVQEDWALEGDYLIFMYSFINTGSEPIRGLRVGFISDHDVYTAERNVANFDPTTGVASVTSADSVSEPITAGMILLGADLGGYRTWLNGTRPLLERADYFVELQNRPLEPSRSDVGDVKQLLAAVPFDLAAGEVRRVGYALVVGQNRDAFHSHVAQARTRALEVW